MPSRALISKRIHVFRLWSAPRWCQPHFPPSSLGSSLISLRFPDLALTPPTSGRTVPYPQAPILIYQLPSPDLLSWQRMLHVNGAMCEQS